MIRAFIAIDLEDASILEKIKKIQLDMKSLGAIKAVELKNIHLTIKFLGNIPEVKVDSIYEAMRQLDLKPFKLGLQGVGVFPNERRARVIWIGVKEGANETVRIFNELEVRLAKLGFPREKKGFTPHFTIGRVKGRVNLTDFLHKWKNIELGCITVKHLRLKKSILKATGPIYETLREVSIE